MSASYTVEEDGAGWSIRVFDRAGVQRVRIYQLGTRADAEREGEREVARLEHDRGVELEAVVGEYQASTRAVR